MSVLLTGGTGFLGRHVLGALLRERSDVRFLCRSATGRPHVRNGDRSVRVVRGDLLDQRSVERAVDGCSEVVHLAAALPGTGADPAQILAVNALGTANLIRAAARSGAERVVVASSIAVYGAPRGSVDEDSPLWGWTPYAVSKRAGEEHVERWFPEAVVLRLGPLVGPGSRLSEELLPRLLAMRAIPRLQRHRLQWVAVEDAASAVVAASRRPGVEGLTVNIAGPEAPTLAHVRSLAAAVCGSPARATVTEERPWPRWVEYHLPYDISLAMAALRFEPGRRMADEVARVARSRRGEGGAAALRVPGMERRW